MFLLNWRAINARSNLHFSIQIKKDFKLTKKRGYDIDELKKVMRLLASEKTLVAKYRDHALTGNHKNKRECHIRPDWILEYEIRGEQIQFYRTGTHSDLFGK